MYPSVMCAINLIHYILQLIIFVIVLFFVYYYITNACYAYDLFMLNCTQIK
eukprot:GAHX01003859.1.p1 GENE.GAHX01003859.1~~GAHX01003859.1.p1  ORF type:complete len:51 (-),score=1.16 GAHX01003859.1:102-254(-)